MPLVVETPAAETRFNEGSSPVLLESTIGNYVGGGNLKFRKMLGPEERATFSTINFYCAVECADLQVVSVAGCEVADRSRTKKR